MRYLILVALLTSCLPAQISVKSTVSMRYEFNQTYTVLAIDSALPIHNVQLKLQGNNLRFNEDRCNIVGNVVHCNLGSLTSYRLPFTGAMTKVNIIFIDNESVSRELNM